MKNNQNGFIGIALIVALLAVVVGGGAYVYTKKMDAERIQKNREQSQLEKTNKDEKKVGEGCYVGGCSGQVCSDEKDVVTTCEYREEYSCYKKATCERQTNGQCGWTSTPNLTSCLNSFSENKKTEPVITIKFTEKYIGPTTWPPIIKNSTTPYSCNPSSGSGDVPTIIENKIINNKDYCVMSITDHAMGKFGTDYRYSTPSTSGTKTAEFLVVGSVCTSILSFDESKTEEDVANCQAEQANFGSKLDKAIDSLMR